MNKMQNFILKRWIFLYYWRGYLCMLSQETGRISKTVLAKDLNVSYVIADFGMWPYLSAPLWINTISTVFQWADRYYGSILNKYIVNGYCCIYLDKRIKFTCPKLRQNVSEKGWSHFSQKSQNYIAGFSVSNNKLESVEREKDKNIFNSAWIVIIKKKSMWPAISGNFLHL